MDDDDRLLDDGDFDYEEVHLHHNMQGYVQYSWLPPQLQVLKLRCIRLLLQVNPASASLSRPQMVSNLPHDEEISLSDSEIHGNITDGASDGECPACGIHVHLESFNSVKWQWEWKMSR